MSDTPLLDVRHLVRRGRDGRLLLDDVSFQVRRRERWGISGPTGAGKSVLLRAVALIDPTDSGEVRWNGAGIQRGDVPRYRSQAVYLHQKPAMLDGSVEDNLRAPFLLREHRERSFDKDRSIALLDQLGLSASFLDKQSSDLSGGELQIAALLRAMQLQPSVLLLDEPTAALDADSVTRIERLVAEWFAELDTQRAVVWVSHDARQMARIASHTLELDRGRVQGANGAA